MSLILWIDAIWVWIRGQTREKVNSILLALEVHFEGVNMQLWCHYSQTQNHTLGRELQQLFLKIQDNKTSLLQTAGSNNIFSQTFENSAPEGQC